MRPRIVFLILTPLVLVLCAIFWVQHNRGNNGSVDIGNNQRDTSFATARPSKAPDTNSIEQTQEVKASRSVPLPSGPSNLNMKLSDLYFGPVDVYGKVVDQNRSPVPNATVNFLVDRSIYDVAKSIKGSVTTDSQGSFHIAGYEATAVGFRPEAPGYVLAEINPRVIIKSDETPAKNYISDPNNPMIIKMWKKKGPEELVSVTKKIEFVPMNSPIHLDLLSGSIVDSGGDLTIQVTRPPGQIGLRQKANWSIKITPVQGGLIRVEGDVLQVTFQAPDSGYEMEDSALRDAGDKNWSMQYGGHFFVRSRNGTVYSKFSMGFLLNGDPQRPCGLNIKSLSNPNASRNWEEDPAKIKKISDW